MLAWGKNAALTAFLDLFLFEPPVYLPHAKMRIKIMKMRRKSLIFGQMVPRQGHDALFFDQYAQDWLSANSMANNKLTPMIWIKRMDVIMMNFLKKF